MSGPAPFGMWRQNGRLVPQLLEAAVVLELVEAFLASGGRIKTTAEVLNQKGRTTRKGGPWTDTAVARILGQQELQDLIPDDLWTRCQAMLAARDDPRQRPGRRPAHPLGGVVHCRCGARMYLRGGGPVDKYVCRGCLAKISCEMLERAFLESLSSLEVAAEEVVEALEGNPRAAELSRRLGPGPVPVSEVWPAFDEAEKRQLVDLFVSQVVVDRDEIAVVFALPADSPGDTAPAQPNSLPSSHGFNAGMDTATRPGTAAEHADPHDPATLPFLLNVDDAARILRTTRSAVYALAERGALPGVTRLGRRLLIRRDDLVAWVHESRAPSPEEV